jgi:propanol-preferring alcohol dehydrogenase
VLVVQTRLQPGQTIGIVGSGGGLGHLGIQFAKAVGLRVVGIDARDEGIALSKDCGAEFIVDARNPKDEVVKQVMEYTGEGCDAVVNVSDADEAAALACAVTRIHGRMIQIAQPDRVSIPFMEFVFRNIKVEGSLISSAKQGDEMLQAVAKHGVTVKTNAFHGLDQVNKVVELSRSGRMKGKGIVIIDRQAIEHEKTQGAKF